MAKKKKHLRFIDLFAGLGGFHLALEQLGCECVMASEIKEDLRHLYKINFPGTDVRGDICSIDEKSIPAFDILCAGFPCQPFSLAGKREGFKDKRGNLFYEICRIVDKHRPRYIILENVSNLKTHDNGNTWNTIRLELEERGYYVAEPAILSPHQFGIPQHRRRIYIVCEDRSKGHLEGFAFPKPMKKPTCEIESIIDHDETDYQHLKEDTRHQLAVWQEFIDLCVAHHVAIPAFPIWGMEFGATYDFEQRIPVETPMEELKKVKGVLGKTVEGKTKAECLDCLPQYARADKFPSWKVRYIRRNRNFYEENKEWLKPWAEQLKDFYPSHQKMEWNCGEANPSLYDKIVQFRGSGIRVKMPTFSPALNLIGTQVPIFPWIKLPEESLSEGEPDKGRYMTVHEASKLQGMDKLKFGNADFNLSVTRCYEALGNAVNVKIVKMIVEKMLKL